MVRKSTEYRTSYRKGNARTIRQNAETKASYCLLRRHTEHRHTPVHWDEPNWEDLDPPCTAPRGVPEHVYKHEKYKGMYDDRRERMLGEKLARMQLDSEVQRRVAANKGSVSPTVGSTLSPSTRSSSGLGSAGEGGKGRKARNRSCEACDTEEAVVQREEEGMEVTPPRRTGPTYKKPIPKPRPMSAPIGRPAKKDFHVNRSPFVPFGFKAKGKEFGTKRTHNVLSQSQVYPAALRAYRRRELEIEKRQERAEDAPYRQRRRKALFNDVFTRKPTVWDTEYRQSYVGYDQGLYKHNIERRYDPKLAWQAYVVP